MYSTTLVGSECRKFGSSCSSDRPARAPSTCGMAWSFGTKPGQLSRPAACAGSSCARARASAGPISSTAMPCGCSSRASSIISAVPRSGDKWPTYTTRRSSSGGAGTSGTYVVFGTTGCGRANRATYPCSARIRCRYRSAIRSAVCTATAAGGRSGRGSHGLVLSAAAVSSCTSQITGGRLCRGGSASSSSGSWTSSRSASAACLARADRAARIAPARRRPEARGTAVSRSEEPVRSGSKSWGSTGAM